MKKALLKLLALSLALTFVMGVLSGCGDTAEKDSDGDVVKIGFVTYLAGDQAYVGQAAKLALEDYVTELNENGGLLGKQVKLITYDYSKDPATEAVNATNKLIQQDGVIAILGPSGSQSAIPMIPVVTAAKIPVIATSASNEAVTIDPNTGKLNEWMFRVCFVDPYQGKALANFAITEAGISKVASLGAIGDPYTEALTKIFEDEFTAKGGEMVKKLNYQYKDVEFRAQLTEAHKAGAEAILALSSYYKDVVLMAQQSRDLGYDFKFLIGDGCYSPELVELAGDELEGSYMISGVSEDDPALKEYSVEFGKKYPGQTANVYVAYSLDAMMLLEYAINKAGSFDTEAIRTALENAQGVKLFSDDNFTVDKETHNPLNKTVSVLKITDGQYTLYKKYKPEG